MQMNAYQLFQPEFKAQDSALVTCFRELWERLVIGQEPTPVDLLQVEHMEGWLQGKVEQYLEVPPHLAVLQPLFDAARQGWEWMLEGVGCLACFLEEGDEALLEEARALTEDGENLLQWLEESIVADRDDSPVCDGFLS